MISKTLTLKGPTPNIEWFLEELQNLQIDDVEIEVLE